MYSIKKKPESDDARSKALSAAKTKKDASLPGDNVISDVNSAALDIEQPLFDAKKELLVIAQAFYHKSVDSCIGDLDILKNRTSHGLQLLNDQIKDKVLNGLKVMREFDSSFIVFDVCGILFTSDKRGSLESGADLFIFSIIFCFTGADCNCFG